jgi:hypothetical protein
MGDVDNAVVFSGDSAPRIKEILPVNEIMTRLVRDASKKLATIR